MESTVGNLLELNERGYQGRSVPISHLRDLQEEIYGRHAQGQLDDEFYRERLAWFDFKPPDSLPGAASLIVVAIPRPQSQVVFTWNGKPHPFILPPTYVEYKKISLQTQELLAGILAPAGWHVAPVKLPLKLLAVRSGLGQYGRNNICHVPGMGSFLQLAAVCSDLPCPQDPWQEPQTMERCRDCHACRKHCPTGAIPSDRFLLHAERCIVFHNERPGQRPFPSWMDPAWHNCLVGCMLCQLVCPENRHVWDWVEAEAEFSHQETALLLEGTPLDRLSTATVEKLRHLELDDSTDAFPRNLGVLLKERG